MTTSRTSALGRSLPLRGRVGATGETARRTPGARRRSRVYLRASPLSGLRDTAPGRVSVPPSAGGPTGPGRKLARFFGSSPKRQGVVRMVKGPSRGAAFAVGARSRFGGVGSVRPRAAKPAARGVRYIGPAGIGPPRPPPPCTGPGVVKQAGEDPVAAPRNRYYTGEDGDRVTESGTSGSRPSRLGVGRRSANARQTRRTGKRGDGVAPDHRPTPGAAVGTTGAVHVRRSEQGEVQPTVHDRVPPGRSRTSEDLLEQGTYATRSGCELNDSGPTTGATVGGSRTTKLRCRAAALRKGSPGRPSNRGGPQADTGYANRCCTSGCKNGPAPERSRSVRPGLLPVARRRARPWNLAACRRFPRAEGAGAALHFQSAGSVGPRRDGLHAARVAGAATVMVRDQAMTGGRAGANRQGSHGRHQQTAGGVIGGRESGRVGHTRAKMYVRLGRASKRTGRTWPRQGQGALEWGR